MTGVDLTFARRQLDTLEQHASNLSHDVKVAIPRLQCAPRAAMLTGLVAWFDCCRAAAAAWQDGDSRDLQLATIHLHNAVSRIEQELSGP